MLSDNCRDGSFDFVWFSKQVSITSEAIDQEVDLGDDDDDEVLPEKRRVESVTEPRVVIEVELSSNRDPALPLAKHVHSIWGNIRLRVFFV